MQSIIADIFWMRLNIIAFPGAIDQDGMMSCHHTSDGLAASACLPGSLGSSVYRDHRYQCQKYLRRQAPHTPGWSFVPVAACFESELNCCFVSTHPGQQRKGRTAEPGAILPRARAG